MPICLSSNRNLIDYARLSGFDLTGHILTFLTCMELNYIKTENFIAVFLEI
jgi:hypothetical protein